MDDTLDGPKEPGSKEDLPMTTTVTIEEAQVKLKELIQQLGPGEAVIITDNQQAVARLVNDRPTPAKPTALLIDPAN